MFVYAGRIWLKFQELQNILSSDVKKTKDSKLDHSLDRQQNRKPDPHFNIKTLQTRKPGIFFW